MARPALFGGKKRTEARFPEGRIGFAVGDIHGRADLLARLFDRLENDGVGAQAPIVVFLGDYIDRGPNSAEVIDLLLGARPENFERRYLKGNHEEAMLAFIADPAAGRAWLSHGGLETLASYDVHPLPALGAGVGALREASERLREKLPDTHLAFLNALERYIVIGDYAFVHAGIDPNRAIDDQRDSDLFWIRDRFLGDDRRLEHMIVHGHTPAQAPFSDHRRIGIDTGAYASGVLTCARLEGAAVDFISVRDR